MRLKLLLSAFLVSVLFLPKSTIAQSSYCTPKYSGNGYQNTGNPTSFFTHVLRVAIGNMDKSIAPPASAFTSQVYYDFTSTDSIRLTQTGAYPLTLELGNGANRQTVAVWIDYNQNNVFETTEIVFKRTDIENQGDHKYLASVTIPKNAVLGHTRMRVATIYGNSVANPCTNSRTDNFPAFIADWSQNFQDYTVEIVKPTVQKFEEVTLSHTNFDEVVPGSSTNEILRIEVTTNEDGLISPLTVDSLYFSLLGNTNLKDISGAKLFYTGKNPTFNTNTPLDSVSNPSLNFTLTNNRTLRQGTNYFWLTLRISNDALIGNIIDARCNGVHVLTKRIPTIVSPGGARRVGYCVSKGNRSMFVYPRWVRFNTISQFSGFSNTGYSNYTFRSTEVQRGNTVTLSIDVGNSVNNSFTRAWIDFNADGDLNDPGEMVLFDSITTANTTPTFGPVVAQVYIPTNAKIGPTRMRITSASKSDQAPWKLPPEPCDAQVEIGEVEDYTVVIAEQGEPVADFRFNTVCQGDTTRFFDGSYTFSIYSISSWDWDFGDGKTSTAQNPTHVYAQAGTYKVRLVANTNKPGTADTVYKIVTVEKPNIDFEMSTNLSKEFITFTDATSGATVVSWDWNFGDPNSLSNTAFGQTVFHEYDTAKTYTVTLVVRTLGGCVDSIKRNITIVDELKPVAVISANDFNPYQTAPLQLQDLSVNRPSSWKWSITPSSHNFVNGTSSSSQNPIVTLNALTTYTVKLVASNSAGSDSTTRDFTTKAYKAPSADFSANQTTVKAGQIVSFLDKSTNDPTKWNWNFGDGDSSLNSNPIHEYAKTGTYTVRLDVENPAGKDFEVKTGYIDVSDEYVMCESDVTSSPLLKGTLYDAGGPNGNYGNNTDCGFLIKPPCAGSITLAFTSFGFISNDYLLVYDGEDATGKPLHPQGGFTGYSRPSPLKATSGAIYIEQHSDGFSDTTGFSATWSSSNNIKPVATMTGTSNGYAGGQAIFNNTTKVGSSGSVANWYVNGQLVSANAERYIHKFDSAGYDTLVLEVANCAGVDTVRRVLKVINSTQKPKANFTKGDTNRVFVNQTVSLLDLSDFGPSSWRWNIPSDFLDYIYVNGTSETDQNIELLFIEPGLYTVKLTVSNAYGADSLTKVQYLLVEPDIAMCSFPNESSAPGGRIADDGGIGFPYIQRNCDFLINPCADKVILSFVKDSFDYAPGDFLRIYDGTDATGVPLHSNNGFTFNNIPSGKYVAESGALFIEHSSQGNASRRRGFLANWTTVAYNNPIVDFELPDTAYTGGNFVFINNTTDEQGNDDVAYRWDFDNDGVYDDSTTKEPIYIFSKSGLVQVKLLVEACDFKDSVIKTIRILNPKAKPNAKFVVNNTNPSTTDLVVFQDRSTNGPNKYRWEITPPNFNITNGSDTFPFMEGFFAAADSYDVKLVVKNKFGADSILLQKHIVVVEYCNPVISNAPVDELSITYVNMVDISNRSQPGISNYEDYTGTYQTNLTAGGTHPIIIQRGGATPNANAKVWIDFNRDGDFDDTLENVLTRTSGAWEILVDSVRVPRNAKKGITRMRISLALGIGANDPCGPKTFGETEDYRVVIGGDGIKPIITLIGDPIEQIELGDSYVDKGATAFDDLDGNITDSIIVFSNVDTAKVGTYEVRYNVKDLAGNRADEVVRKVTVLADTTKPVITLVGGTVFMDVYTSYVEPGFSANDNWDGDVTKYVTSNAASIIDTFRLDTFEVQYTARDLTNNEAIAYRQVIVQDTIKPVVTLKGNANVVIDSGMVYVEDSATITDNYWTDLQLVIVGKVNVNKPGTYTITYSTIDLSKNAAVPRTRTVVVKRVIGVGEIDGLEQMQVYPNPAVEQVNVKLQYNGLDNAQWRVTNALGQTIKVWNNQVGGITQESVDVKNLEAGVYFIELQIGGQIAKMRFTVIH